MKKTLIVFILYSAIIGYAYSQAAETIEMISGQSKIIDAVNVKRVAVGNPEIVDISVVSEHEIRIIAKSEGRTTVEIWENNESVKALDLKILSVDTAGIIRKLKVFLGEDVMNLIRINPIENGKIIIEGEYDTYEDVNRIEAVVKPFGDKIVNLIKPSSILKDTLSYKITELIGIDTAKVRMVNKTVFIDGVVPSENERERAGKIAKLFSKKVVNTLEIGSNRLVQVDVRIYEMSAEFTSDLDINLLSPAGINTGTSYSYRLLQRPVGGVFNSIISIDNQLKAEIGKGRGKLLAKPKLVTANGEKATFMSGGERGYQVLSAQGVPTIEWKKYGIEVEIESLITDINGTDNIKLHVNARLSELDELSTSLSVAAINSSSADVKVFMKPEETLLIAGLLKKKLSKTVSRFPLLGYIPIIEVLFKKTREEVIDNELLMFITPRIVSAKGIPNELEIMKNRQDIEYETIDDKKVNE